MVLQLFVQFQIARQEHIQRGGGFGDKAAGVVVSQRFLAGLREGVALIPDALPDDIRAIYDSSHKK